MNKNNLRKANELCKKSDQLISHRDQFNSVVTDDLPAEQYQKQQDYLNSLNREIKKIEKQISEL